MAQAASTTRKSLAVKAFAAVKSLSALSVLALTLPFTLVVLAATRAAAPAKPRICSARPMTVLISGGKMTKALQLARSFQNGGHRVILAETHAYRFTGHRFSRAVAAFHIIPDPQDPDYVNAIRRIVEREQVDIYVPVSSPASSVPDAIAKAELADLCQVMHGDEDIIRQLDDKTAFSALAQALDLPVPAFVRVTHQDQVKGFDFAADGRRYILKSVAYDPVRRLDLTRLPCATPEETAAFVEALPISETNPWIMQEFIEGTEYCTHSTVQAGRVTLHACCLSSASQLNYAHVNKSEMAAWAARLVGAIGITGQVSLDFIEASDGRIYAIECNPRTHSAITMFYDHPGVAPAYLDADASAVEPLTDSRPTYWIFNELFEGITKPTTIPSRIKTIVQGKEAIFDARDPLPFFVAHHVQMPLLLLRALFALTPWVKIDFNIGKLVMLAGD